jgi:hypothetical protein
MMDLAGGIHPTLAQRASLGARRASSAPMFENWTAYADYEHSPGAKAAGTAAGSPETTHTTEKGVNGTGAGAAEKLPEVRAELFNNAFSFGSGGSVVAAAPDAATATKLGHHSRTSSHAHTHVSPIEHPVALAAEASPYMGLELALGHEQHQHQQHWDVASQPLSYPC